MTENENILEKFTAGLIIGCFAGVTMIALCMAAGKGKADGEFGESGREIVEQFLMGTDEDKKLKSDRDGKKATSQST